MKKYVIQALVIFLIGSAVGFVYNVVSPEGISIIAAENKTLTGFRMVTTEETQLYLKEGGNVILIDSRSPEEYFLGHIPGAINIPDGQVEEYFRKFEQKLKKAQLLIVYCSGGSCGTSEEVAKALISKGISDSKVAVDQDGLPGWIRTKNPIETGA